MDSVSFHVRNVEVKKGSLTVVLQADDTSTSYLLTSSDDNDFELRVIDDVPIEQPKLYPSPSRQSSAHSYIFYGTCDRPTINKSSNDMPNTFGLGFINYADNQFRMLIPFMSEPVLLVHDSEALHSVSFSISPVTCISHMFLRIIQRGVSIIKVVPFDSNEGLAKNLLVSDPISLAINSVGVMVTRPGFRWRENEVVIFYLEMMRLGTLHLRVVILSQTSTTWRIVNEWCQPLPTGDTPPLTADDLYGSLIVDERVIQRWSDEDVATFIVVLVSDRESSSGLYLSVEFPNSAKDVYDVLKISVIPPVSYSPINFLPGLTISMMHCTVTCHPIISFPIFTVEIDQFLEGYKNDALGKIDSSINSLISGLSLILETNLFSRLNDIRTMIRVIFGLQDLQCHSVACCFDSTGQVDCSRIFQIFDTDRILMNLMIHLPRPDGNGECWLPSMLGLVKKLFLYHHLGLVKQSTYKRTFIKISSYFDLHLPIPSAPPLDWPLINDSCICASVILLMSPHSAYPTSIISRIIRDTQCPHGIALGALGLVVGYYSSASDDDPFWIVEGRRLIYLVESLHDHLLKRGEIEAQGDGTMPTRLPLLVGLTIGMYYITRGSCELAIPLTIFNDDLEGGRSDLWLPVKDIFNSLISLAIINILLTSDPRVRGPLVANNSTKLSESDTTLFPLTLFWLLGFVEPSIISVGQDSNMNHKYDSLRFGPPLLNSSTTPVIQDRIYLSFVMLAISQHTDSGSSSGRIISSFTNPCRVFRNHSDHNYKNFEGGMLSRVMNCVPLSQFIPQENLIYNSAQERFLSSGARSVVRELSTSTSRLSSSPMKPENGSLSLKLVDWEYENLSPPTATNCVSLVDEKKGNVALKSGLWLRILALLLVQCGSNSCEKVQLIQEVVSLVVSYDINAFWAVIASAYTARLTDSPGIPALITWRKNIINLMDFIVQNQQSVCKLLVQRFCSLLTQAVHPRSTGQRNLLMPEVMHVIRSMVSAFPFVAYSEAKLCIGVGSQDGSIILYDLKRGGQVKMTERHRGAVACLGFSTSGTVMASFCLSDVKFFSWNLSTSGLWGSVTGAFRTGILSSVQTLPNIPCSTELFNPDEVKLVHIDTTNQKRDAPHWMIRRENGEWFVIPVTVESEVLN
eukprot:GHVH01011272.1.p1 GENE.GHVH01011272.1~~GHVH01011272.1.p1  ORF type:complete len:1319 (-),score=148.75 GHVH01011272.1:158-3574(-)